MTLDHVHAHPEAFPSGTVTFLFSDIEGSTQLLHRLGATYADVLDAHHRLVRAALGAHAGIEVDTAGDGFFAAFARATDAVAAAVDIQRRLADHAWPEDEAVRVRIGLHTGEPFLTSTGYTGLVVHRAARIMGTGWGGQVLLSDATRRLVTSALPAGVALRDLGTHTLKDFDAPAPLTQLDIEGLPSDFPPPRTLAALAHNLPRPPTPLLGREAEVERVLEHVRSGARLVTLTGPGGTGKTRLGVEVAERLLSAPDLALDGGAWFVPLAPVSDPTLVPQTIALALGVKEERDRTTLDALVAFVGSHPMLVILDNMEQVLEAAPFVAEWLMACPSLRVLTTSRAALRLQGEHEVPIPPLALPDARHSVPADALVQYAAVRLFIDRACAVRPGFRVDDENAPAVASLCTRLDGLPLALELAAARVRMFSPEALLTRLAGNEARRLDVLRGGARDLPGRHQTLRDTIRWSYDLLPPEEQSLFRRLAVFVGGFTLEAAVSIAADVHSDPEEGVLALLDHSLLRRVDGLEGEPRFHLLETIREFGLDALDVSGETAAARDAHVRHFLALAEQAEPHLTGPDQGRWLDRLDAEQSNLRAALDHLEATDDIEAALQMAKALGRFWIVRSHVGEGHRRLSRLVALSRDHAPSDAWIAVRNNAGILAQFAGDLTAALSLLDEVVHTCRTNGNPDGLATALSHLAYTYIELGKADDARPLCEEALAIREEAGDLRGQAVALQNLGILGTLEGRYAEADAFLLRGREKRRQLGAQRGIAFCHHWLAFNSVWWGRPAKALAYAEEGIHHVQGIDDTQVEAVLHHNAAFALVALERIDATLDALAVSLPGWEWSGNPSGLAISEMVHALVLSIQGEDAAARETIERAIQRCRPTQFQWGVGFGLVNRGEILLTFGDLDSARVSFDEAKAFNEGIHNVRGLADVHLGLGRLAHEAGHSDDAQAALGEAARLYAAHDISLSPRLATLYGEALREHGLSIPEAAP